MLLQSGWRPPRLRALIPRPPFVPSHRRWILHLRWTLRAAPAQRPPQLRPRPRLPRRCSCGAARGHLGLQEAATALWCGTILLHFSASVCCCITLLQRAAATCCCGTLLLQKGAAGYRACVSLTRHSRPSESAIRVSHLSRSGRLLSLRLSPVIYFSAGLFYKLHFLLDCCLQDRRRA